VPLHQLHPVVVHAALFGGGYGPRAGALARTVLGAR
jgi:fructosamine-3-kinase